MGAQLAEVVHNPRGWPVYPDVAHVEVPILEIVQWRQHPHRFQVVLDFGSMEVWGSAMSHPEQYKGRIAAGDVVSQPEAGVPLKYLITNYFASPTAQHESTRTPMPDFSNLSDLTVLARGSPMYAVPFDPLPFFGAAKLEVPIHFRINFQWNGNSQFYDYRFMCVADRGT
jgi:hypothetical protein